MREGKGVLPTLWGRKSRMGFRMGFINRRKRS